MRRFEVSADLLGTEELPDKLFDQVGGFRIDFCVFQPVRSLPSIADSLHHPMIGIPMGISVSISFDLSTNRRRMSVQCDRDFLLGFTLSQCLSYIKPFFFTQLLMVFHGAVPRVRLDALQPHRTHYGWPQKLHLLYESAVASQMNVD
jgi:hypothetical protein